jgi:hypothetical protein
MMKVFAVATVGILIWLSHASSAQIQLDNKWLTEPAPNPDMVYRVQPNQMFTTLGVRFPTNEYGFRDGPIYPKDSATFRILCVGDSVTFGTGVKNEETFPNVLEAMLTQYGATGRRFDVINAGVSAYNIRNIRALVAEYLDEIQPDAVVYTFVENDLDDSMSSAPGGMLMALDPSKSPDEPFVADDYPAMWLLRRQAEGKTGFFGRILSVFDNELALASESPPPLLIGDHRESQLRWAHFQTELTTMRDLCAAGSIPFLLYSFGLANHSEPVFDRVNRVCDSLGIPHASTLPIFHKETYMEQHSLGHDPHCNPLGNRMMADRLLCFLADTGTLPPLAQGDGFLPHRHFDETIDPGLVASIKTKALAMPRVIDPPAGEGALGMLAGVDTQGRMARWGLFRLAPPGEAIVVTASGLFATPEDPQTLSLEVEGSSFQSPAVLTASPTEVVFTIPPEYNDRTVEIKLVAGGKVWLPNPRERVEGKSPTTLQIYKIERTERQR